MFDIFHLHHHWASFTTTIAIIPKFHLHMISSTRDGLGCQVAMEVEFRVTVLSSGDEGCLVIVIVVEGA